MEEKINNVAEKIDEFSKDIEKLMNSNSIQIARKIISIDELSKKQ